MPKNKKHIIPYVKKTSITIVDIGSFELEPLRAVLEGFNYRIDAIRIGSRAEFIKILNGEIETNNILILAVHGTRDGAKEEGINMPDEEAVVTKDIIQFANLKGKTVINLGCLTGNNNLVKAFINKAQAKYYIAPAGAPWGNSSLLFAIHLFYEMDKGKSTEEAVKIASNFDERTKMFKLFKK